METLSTDAHAPEASFDRVRAALEAVSGPGRGAGSWTTYLCPSHDDSSPSLGIKYDAAQEKTVVKCFSGCDDADVLERIGLQVRDLFDVPRGRGDRSGATAPRSRPPVARVVPKEHELGALIGPRRTVAIYIYTDERGIERGEVVRTATPRQRGEQKGFYQRTVDPGGRRSPGRFDPLLYRLPQVRAAVRSGAPVYVMEGEKDADRAVQLGLTATCNAMGALSFRPEHADQLRGAARVVIVADRDTTGYKHAQRVAELLDGLVGEVQVVEAVDGKDFSDHCDAGHFVEELIVIDPAQRLDALTSGANSPPTATEGTTMTAAVEQDEPTITLYTKPDCQQCDATKRALSKLGHRVGETYRAVDVTEDAAALARIRGLGYLQAPVVVSGDVHFSGFRPDRLKALPAPSAPDREQGTAGEERAVSGPGFRNVGGVTLTDYVSRDMVSVQNWAAPFLRSAAQRGTIPPLGSQEWVLLPHNDPRKTGAVVEAALQRVREIAAIPENVRFDLAMTPDPEQQAPRDVLDAMKEQYARQHPDFDGTDESLNRLKNSWHPKPRPTFAELQRARWGDRAKEMSAAAERKHAAERAGGPLNWSPDDVAGLVEQSRDQERSESPLPPALPAQAAPVRRERPRPQSL